MKEFKISQICEVVSGGTPSTKTAAYWGGDIVWLTPKDLSNNTSKWIGESINTITQEGLNNSSAQMLPKDAVLLSSRAPIGYLALAARPLCTNQGFKSMVCNENIILPEYLYYLLQTKVEDLNNKKEIAKIRGEVLWDNVLNKQIDMPNEKVSLPIIYYSILLGIDIIIRIYLLINKIL